MHAQWAMHSCLCVCYTYIINYILYRPSDKHKELLERNVATQICQNISDRPYFQNGIS